MPEPDKAILVVGEAEFPFHIVQENAGRVFHAELGKQEIIDGV